MLILSTIMHRIDPFAVQFWEGFGIRWYGLSYVAGFVVSYLIIRALARRGRAALPVERVADFVVTVAVGIVVGGRLGYCLFYSRPLFIEFTGDFPYWGVLAMHRGGMASHGGIIGLILACMWFARRYQVSSLHLMDLTTLGGTIGVVFGRLANFVNGELVGRTCRDTLAWAVKFPQDILDWPLQLKELLFTKLNGGWSGDEPQRFAQFREHLLDLDPVMQLEPMGLAPGAWRPLVDRAYADPDVYQHGQHATDFVIEARKHVGQLLEMAVATTQSLNSTGDAVVAALAPLLPARHPSQIYQALMEGLLLCLILLLIWRAPRKPGVISGWFLVGYGLFRITGEQFRQPDYVLNQFEAMTHVTRGQWLSGLMVIAGIGLLWYWSRRDVARIGGWGTSDPSQKS